MGFVCVGATSSHVGWIKQQRNPRKDIMKMPESRYPGFKDFEDE